MGKGEYWRMKFDVFFEDKQRNVRWSYDDVIFLQIFGDNSIKIRCDDGFSVIVCANEYDLFCIMNEIEINNMTDEEYFSDDVDERKGD